jgi:hypothetical protein
MLGDLLQGNHFELATATMAWLWGGKGIIGFDGDKSDAAFDPYRCMWDLRVCL